MRVWHILFAALAFFVTVAGGYAAFEMTMTLSQDRDIGATVAGIVMTATILVFIKAGDGHI